MAKHVLFFNERTRRPGCVLIQAALGGDTTFLKDHVPSEWWTTEFEGMVPLTVTDDEAPEFTKALQTLHQGGWPAL